MFCWWLLNQSPFYWHEVMLIPAWTSNYALRTTKLLEGILVSLRPSVRPSVRLSVRPSVRPSRIPCPLCSSYSSGWIYFIFIHLIKQLQKVCLVESFFQHLNFWQFFKICIFYLVLSWLGIWCESLVWVIMGQRRVSQNESVLVVLVIPNLMCLMK